MWRWPKAAKGVVAEAPERLPHVSLWVRIQILKAAHQRKSISTLHELSWFRFVHHGMHQNNTASDLSFPGISVLIVAHTKHTVYKVCTPSLTPVLKPPLITDLTFHLNKCRPFPVVQKSLWREEALQV